MATPRYKQKAEDVAPGKKRAIQGWRGRVYLPDPTAPDGRRAIEQTFRTKREAEAWEASYRHQRNTGSLIDPDKRKVTFADLYDLWREARFASLAPKSQARYEQVWRTHLKPTFGGMKASAITKEAVRRYFGQLGRRVEAGEIAAGTVAKIHTTLSAIFTEGIELGAVAANPCARVKLPRVEAKDPHFLSDEEIRRLANAMPTPMDALLVRTAAYTGLRAGELHALRVRDVDTLHGRINVQRALKVWKDAVPEFGPTKSGKGRVVPLAPWLREQLAAHIAALPAANPDALVFTNREGGAIHQVAWLRNHFKPAVEVALPDRADYKNGDGLRFHDLRHTCASLLLAEGAHMVAVQQWLGHADITTTMRYAHLAPGAHDALALTLGASAQPPADVTELRPVAAGSAS